MGWAPRTRAAAGIDPGAAKCTRMRIAGIDLSAELQLRSLRSGGDMPCCASCRRRPLPGELLHVYDGGQTLCTLCARELPDGAEAPVRSERVYATERQLDVVPRAA